MTTYNKPMCPHCKKVDSIKQFKYIGKVNRVCSSCGKNYVIHRIDKGMYRNY